MKKLLLILLCLPMIGFGQERVSEDELTESENRYYYHGKLFNGISELYDEHGGLWKEWNYKDGQRNGLYKRWSESGRLKHEGNYKEGQLNGVFKVSHRSSVGGQLRYEWNYKDGKRNGLGEEWYESGHLKSEGNYKNDEKEGSWHEYDEVGYIKQTSEYKDGKIISKNCWDEDGNKEDFGQEIKTAVVSATKMNILYTGLEPIGGNPIKVSVPGYTASEITPRMSNGTLKLEKKSEGMYSAFPNVGTTSAIITLYANVDGKQAKIGKVDFRVTKPPSPSALIRSIDANGLCDRSTLKNEIVQATLDNFLFDGLKYKVTSFKLAGVYKGAPISCEQKNGMGFTDKMKAIITNSTSGSTINISKIKAKLIGSKLPSKNVIGDLVIEIK